MAATRKEKTEMQTVTTTICAPEGDLGLSTTRGTTRKRLEATVMRTRPTTLAMGAEFWCEKPNVACPTYSGQGLRVVCLSSLSQRPSRFLGAVF